MAQSDTPAKVFRWPYYPVFSISASLRQKQALSANAALGAAKRPTIITPGGTSADEGSFVSPLISLKPSVDEEDSSVVMILELNGFVDSSSRQDVPFIRRLGSFTANFDFEQACLDILSVTNAPQIGTHIGLNRRDDKLVVNWSSATGVEVPTELATVLVRLSGSATSRCSIELTHIILAEAGGGANLDLDLSISQEFLRGDANADFAVNSTDALWIEECDIGSRPTGIGDGFCHPINSASVFHDTPDRDILNAFDAWVIRQYELDFRDAFFDNKPPK